MSEREREKWNKSQQAKQLECPVFGSSTARSSHVHHHTHTHTRRVSHIRWHWDPLVIIGFNNMTDYFIVNRQQLHYFSVCGVLNRTDFLRSNTTSTTTTIWWAISSSHTTTSVIARYHGHPVDPNKVCLLFWLSSVSWSQRSIVVSLTSILFGVPYDLKPTAAIPPSFQSTLNLCNEPNLCRHFPRFPSVNFDPSKLSSKLPLLPHKLIDRDTRQFCFHFFWRRKIVGPITCWSTLLSQSLSFLVSVWSYVWTVCGSINLTLFCWPFSLSLSFWQSPITATDN